MGAYGGRADVMSDGPRRTDVSGRDVVRESRRDDGRSVGVEEPQTHDVRDLARRSARCWPRDTDAARDAGVPLQVNAFGSLLTPFFTQRRSATISRLLLRIRAYAAFFHGMLKRGVYPPPSQFEAWFLSAAHTDAHIKRTIAAAMGAMKDVRRLVG